MRHILVFLYTFTVLFLPLNGFASSRENSQVGQKKDFNIVLITIDALRADHLSCYGYERETTPHIDRIAQEGVLFENAFASVPVTLPSHISIFTGHYPHSHGVRNNGT